MKILSVQFSNLNSLQGKHSVSFVNGPLAGEGLFAITGPTGAGKSTILDAITLALYGRAARYRSRPSPPDMITRGCADASAEVMFQIARTKQYRACWYMYRTKKKPDGVPQPAKRYIYDEHGVELASGTRACDDLIVDLIGLTPDRFFRSAMLAQGEFSRFLQADERERADLLESLTSTEIYSDLGIAAYRNYTDAKETLTKRRTALESVQLMADELKLEKFQKKEQLLADSVRIRTELEEQQKRMQNIERWRQIENERLRLIDLSDALETQRASFAPELARLQAHLSALSFRNELTLVELCEDQANTRNEALVLHTASLDQSQKTLKRFNGRVRIWVEEKLAAIALQLKELELESASLQAQIASVNEWMKNHRNYADLAERINELQRQANRIALTHQTLEHIHQSIDQMGREASARDQKIVNAEQDIQRAKIDVEHHLASVRAIQQRIGEILAAENGAAIEGLVLERSASIERLTTLLKHEQDAAAIELSLTRYGIELEQRQAKSESLLQTARGTDAQLKLNENLIDALSQGYLQAERIKSLEEHRNGLEDGQPCPLCGSIEHPYLEGMDIRASLSDTKDKLDKAKREHQDLSQTQRNNYQLIAENDANLMNCKSQLDALGIQKAEVIESIRILLKDSSRLSIDSINMLLVTERQSLAELQSKQEEAEELESKQEEELAQQRLLQSRLEIIVAQIDSFKQENHNTRESLERLEQQRQQKQLACDKFLEDFDRSISQWHGRPTDEEIENTIEHLNGLVKLYRLYSDKRVNLNVEIQSCQNVDVRINAELEKLIELKAHTQRLIDQFGSGSTHFDPSDTENFSSASEASTELSRLENNWKDVRVCETAARAGVEAAVEQLNQANQALILKLASSEFRDRQSLKRVLLAEEESQRIQERKSFFQQEASRIESVLNSRRSELEELSVDADTVAADAKQLVLSIEGLKDQLDQMTREMGMLDQQLVHDSESRNSIAQGHQQLLESERAIETSRMLSELIGSADGKKFRAFTQGLMLGYLIRKANRHLSRFNGRYILTRGTTSELELEICDTHQANVTRPLASLSGGESFLVSLALALGLSDLSGSKVEIDSLFIDEGFGTLDSDSLDIAISALEMLRGENKTIGIISHVESLKERIATQIRVEKLANGRSHITIGTNLK